MSADTSLDEARGPIHDAQVALTKAVWHCIVDASSMNVVMSGSEYNAAVRAFRRAIEAAIRAEAEAKVAALREALEDMVRQFAYWSESIGGVGTGGLSPLEAAFDLLGWEDPHPLPDRRCDEPGCMKDATMGWPTRPGGTGPNGGYRRTCWDHSDTGKTAAALTEGSER